MIRKPASRRRFGAVVVETAVIMVLLTSLVFGIFEYGRLLMDWSLLNNAAREGCRYALVNNTSSTISTERSERRDLVHGRPDGKFPELHRDGDRDPRRSVATPVNNLGPGDPITVTVSGKYQFLNIIPLAQMPTSWTMSSSVTMLCEGGT